MLLSNIVQVQGCQIFNRQKLGWGGRERNDHFEIAPALIANFHHHFLAPGFLIEVTEGMVIFVSAIQTLQAMERPVRATLSAAQMLAKMVTLQFAQYRTRAADRTAAFVPRDSVKKGCQLSVPRMKGWLQSTLRQRPDKSGIEMQALRGGCDRALITGSNAG
jgi:hypothetical protein